MSTADDWLARWQREREEREAQARRTLADLAGALRLLGVRTVAAPYDGEGDSGSLEDPVYDPAPPAGLPAGLREELELAFYGLLPSGWEINEGSAGTIRLDTATGEAAVDHVWREEDPTDQDEDEGDDFDYGLEETDDPTSPPAEKP